MIGRGRGERRGKVVGRASDRTERLWCALARSSIALALAAGALAMPALSGGCSGNGEVVLIGGREVPAEDIDRDPIAILPAGAIMVGSLDARALFSTELGPDVARLVGNLVPLGPDSGFVPSRDVDRIVGGLYAMTGADFCVVVTGRFDSDAIARSAGARATAPNGLPLVKSRYGGFDMYTAGNVGFVVLTSHTVLSGNETGMRRALDRLRFGKLETSVVSWMVDLLKTKNASFAIAGDVGAQPGIDAVAAQYPFVGGLRYVRIIGNFQPPGVNVVGALTYQDQTSAAQAATALQNVRSLTAFMSLLSALGFGSATPAMQVAQNQSDVAFTLPLDVYFARILLGKVADLAALPQNR